MKGLLLLFVSATAVIHADMAPALVWTGDPTTASGIGFVGVQGSATSTGMIVTAACISTGPSCGGQFGIFRDFTVISPGAFTITGSVNNDVTAFNCIPPFCNPSSFVTASFHIIGGCCSGDRPAVGIDLATTGSAASPNTEVDLLQTDAKSIVTTLALGDYSLDEFYNGSVQGSGDITVRFTGEFSVIPTPEPRGYVFTAAVAFVLLVVVVANCRATSFTRSLKYTING